MALDIAALTASVTHTVISFTPDGGLFENTETGRKIQSSFLTLTCGHTYRWTPLVGSDVEPTVGSGTMCSPCTVTLFAQIREARHA